MEWQQIASLGIVGVAAFLLIRGRLRPNRVRPADACGDCTGCGQEEVGDHAPTPRR